MNKKMSAWLLLGAFVAVSGLSACAGTYDPEPNTGKRAEREDPEYITGSRLPRKSREIPVGVVVTSGEALSKQGNQGARSTSGPAGR